MVKLVQTRRQEKEVEKQVKRRDRRKKGIAGVNKDPEVAPWSKEKVPG